MHVNRKDAREAGDRFYLPGKPCRNGHSSPRYVSTGHCSACLAAARGADQEQHRQAMAARFAGDRLFTYRLHADDHAAAQAFCQALDLQRGRTPQVPQAVAATPAAPVAPVMPEWLQRLRAGEAASPPGVEQPQAARYVPSELARHTQPTDER